MTTLLLETPPPALPVAPVLPVGAVTQAQPVPTAGVISQEQKIVPNASARVALEPGLDLPGLLAKLSLDKYTNKFLAEEVNLPTIWCIILAVIFYIIMKPKNRHPNLSWLVSLSKSIQW